MRALFVTSATTDVDSLVRAWDCWQPDKSVRVAFHHMGQPKDDEILAVARDVAPEIIFYIGACHAPGIPSVDTLLTLRQMAPSVNLCCDAGDWPWHEYLNLYEEAGCFDLQVTLDGCRSAPVDLVTVTPVDPLPYERAIPRTIRCGFSGGLSSKTRAVFSSSFPNRRPAKRTKFRPPSALPAWTPQHKKFHEEPVNPQMSRDRIIWNLEDMQDVITVRRRTPSGSYFDHAEFLMSCRMVVNTSGSGTGRMHQIKGRVLEAGWAGCALLESEGSPIADWMPEGSYFIYRSAEDAKRLIETLRDDQIAESAAELSAHVKTHYHPRQIYGEMLERLC